MDHKWEHRTPPTSKVMGVGRQQQPFMCTMIKILKLLTPLMGYSLLKGQTIEAVSSVSVDSTGRCGLESIVPWQLISNWWGTWFADTRQSSVDVTG